MTTRSKLPSTVYLLGLTIFSLVTAEFMVAGMMPALAEAFSVSLAQVGNLIAYYALGMALGGPPVTVLLLSRGISNKRALVWLLTCYVIAGAVAAAAPSYGVLAFARIIMGISSAVCIGLCMTICAGLVAPEGRGRAVSVVLAGLMLSPVIGVPMTTWVEQHVGWRASSWAVVALAMLCTVLATRRLPAIQKGGEPPLSQQWAGLKNPKLWGAYITSGLIIGGTFAAFSYCTPILIHEVGIAPTLVAPVLAIYGVANLMGNMIVGRFADRHTFPCPGLGPCADGAGIGWFRLGGRSSLDEPGLLLRAWAHRCRLEPGDGCAGDEGGRTCGHGQHSAHLGDHCGPGVWQLGGWCRDRCRVWLAFAAMGRCRNGAGGSDQSRACDEPGTTRR
ncbi:MFS transporter [Pseudomonas viridiflava]|uniref:MFS transporter n=1 Tax=Pseudomonas viridiflava TaxID=33069 RepID=UPI001F1419C5|nr:MFS transporter [Pseudomonas viridiflava]